MKKSFACQNNVSSLSLSRTHTPVLAASCARVVLSDQSKHSRNTLLFKRPLRARPREVFASPKAMACCLCVPSLPPPSISLALPPSLSPLPPPPLPPSFPLSPNLCFCLCLCGMSCPSWQWHRTGSRWSPVRTLPVAPLWCGLGFFPNSRGNKAAANLRPLSPNERSSKAGRDEGTEGRTKGGSE